jgi:hypothetical protein
LPALHGLSCRRNASSPHFATPITKTYAHKKRPEIPAAELSERHSLANMEGYAKVAHLMASQEEFAILRRFRELNIQRLLYLQAEVIHLESEVKQLAKRNATHEDRIFHAKDWWSLSQAGGEEDLEQWQKFSELSEKLDLYSMLSETTSPSTYLIKYITRWLAVETSFSSQTRAAKTIRS